MSTPKISIISILADILAILIPAAIVSEKYSIYFYVVIGLDILILTCISIYNLIKSNGKIEIAKFLNGEKFISGLIWAVGAAIWAINKDWLGAAIWAILAILLFVSGLHKRNLDSI